MLDAESIHWIVPVTVMCVLCVYGGLCLCLYLTVLYVSLLLPYSAPPSGRRGPGPWSVAAPPSSSPPWTPIWYLIRNATNAQLVQESVLAYAAQYNTSWAPRRPRVVPDGVVRLLC